MDIASGRPEDHTALLPLDASSIPGVAPVTPIGPRQLTAADQTPARDLTGERLAQLAGYEQDITAAQHTGMSAETGRRDRYATDMEPIGASYGDEITLPEPPPYNMYFPESNP